jgi:PAS domain S-box-containing protein
VVASVGPGDYSRGKRATSTQRQSSGPTDSPRGIRERREQRSGASDNAVAVRRPTTTTVLGAAFLAGRRATDIVKYYETLVDGIADGLVIQDRLGRVTHANETAALAVGFPSVDAFVAASLDEHRARYAVFDEQGLPLDLQQFPGFPVVRGEPRGERVVRFHVFATGREFWTAVRSIPIGDEHEQVIVVVSSFRELKDRPRMDVDRARLAAMVEHSRDAIVTTAVDGSIDSWNPAAERLFGYTKTQAVGRSLAMLIDRDRPEKRVQILDAIRTGGRVEDDETPWIAKSGRPLDMAVSVSPISRADGLLLGAAIVVRDISDWKWLQGQYRQAQKLEAVGRLASGIAHDFNNLVTVIGGFSELLLMQLDQADSRRGLVEEIARAGERASALTRQLLVFSRHQVMLPRQLNLNDVVVETEKMLRRLIGEDVEFVSALDPELGPIVADPGQIEQVIVNLAVNARDAMPGGGTLTIATANASTVPTQVLAQPWTIAGPYVVLSVSDTGHGMDQATRARVFEPFFTTKPLNKGTGLGLATVQNIVKQLGGHVELESELGRGTMFRIYFPRVDSASTATMAADALADPMGGSETILIVEDDIVVRSLISQVLVSQGYQVLETANGEEAQRVAAEHTGPIQLLVTDVVLPGLGGPVVAERLKALLPSLKVVFLSGYGESAIVRHGVQHADGPFLPKPFIPSALVRLVRETLDGGKLE